MKWDRAKGNWSRVCWGESVVDEIDVRTREELIGRLRTKYGYSKEKAEARAWPVFLDSRWQSAQQGNSPQ